MVQTNSSLKNKEIFWNFCFEKSKLKTFILWFYLTYGEHKSIELLEQLKNLGFEYATKAGVSIGIDDLKIPPHKPLLLAKAEKENIRSISQFEKGELTGVERFQRLINTWHETSEKIKQEVVNHFESTDILNPVYMMAFSGARGNISQVRQLVGMRGLMADPKGQIIDFPIRSNFREGLTLTEYIISTYGARKGIVDTALRTANAGYLTRRLVDVAQHVIVSNLDCGTKRGIYLKDMKEGKKTLISVSNRLIGRVLAKDIDIITKENRDAGAQSSKPMEMTKIGYRNQEITSTLATRIAQLLTSSNEETLVVGRGTPRINSGKNVVHTGVYVRSPLTCETKRLVCQLCYGWNLGQTKLVSIGEAVGVLAAQSIGEPGTQLTMRTFHTGGVFAGDITDQIKAPFDGKINYLTAIPGTLIRNSEGQIAFLTKVDGGFVLSNQNVLISDLERLKYTNSDTGPKSRIATASSLPPPLEDKGGGVTAPFFIPTKEAVKKATDPLRDAAEDDADLLLGKKNQEILTNQQPVLNKDKLDLKHYKIPAFSVLFCKNGENVKEKQILAQISSVDKIEKDDAEQKIKSDLEGQIRVRNLSLITKINEYEDTVSTINNWGQVWLLEGKIYELPIKSNFFPKIGDFINKKTLMNKTILYFFTGNKFDSTSARKSAEEIVEKSLDSIKRAPRDFNTTSLTQTDSYKNLKKTNEKNQTKSFNKIGLEEKKQINTPSFLSSFSSPFVIKRYHKTGVSNTKNRKQIKVFSSLSSVKKLGASKSNKFGTFKFNELNKQRVNLSYYVLKPVFLYQTNKIYWRIQKSQTREFALVQNKGQKTLRDNPIYQRGTKYNEQLIEKFLDFSFNKLLYKKTSPGYFFLKNIQSDITYIEDNNFKLVKCFLPCALGMKKTSELIHQKSLNSSFPNDSYTPLDLNPGAAGGFDTWSKNESNTVSLASIGSSSLGKPLLYNLDTERGFSILKRSHILKSFTGGTTNMAKPIIYISLPYSIQNTENIANSNSLMSQNSESSSLLFLAQNGFQLNTKAKKKYFSAGTNFFSRLQSSSEGIQSSVNTFGGTRNALPPRTKNEESRQPEQTNRLARSVSQNPGYSIGVPRDFAGINGASFRSLFNGRGAHKQGIAHLESFSGITASIKRSKIKSTLKSPWLPELLPQPASKTKKPKTMGVIWSKFLISEKQQKFYPHRFAKDQKRPESYGPTNVSNPTRSHEKRGVATPVAFIESSVFEKTKAKNEENTEYQNTKMLFLPFCKNKKYPINLTPLFLAGMQSGRNMLNLITNMTLSIKPSSLEFLSSDWALFISKSLCPVSLMDYVQKPKRGFYDLGQQKVKSTVQTKSRNKILQNAQKSLQNTLSLTPSVYYPLYSKRLTNNKKEVNTPIYHYSTKDRASHTTNGVLPLFGLGYIRPADKNDNFFKRNINLLISAIKLNSSVKKSLNLFFYYFCKQNKILRQTRIEKTFYYDPHLDQNPQMKSEKTISVILKKMFFQYNFMLFLNSPIHYYSTLQNNYFGKSEGFSHSVVGSAVEDEDQRVAPETGLVFNLFDRSSPFTPQRGVSRRQGGASAKTLHETTRNIMSGVSGYTKGSNSGSLQQKKPFGTKSRRLKGEPAKNGIKNDQNSFFNIAKKTEKELYSYKTITKVKMQEEFLISNQPLEALSLDPQARLLIFGKVFDARSLGTATPRPSFLFPRNTKLHSVPLSSTFRSTGFFKTGTLVGQGGNRHTSVPSTLAEVTEHSDKSTISLEEKNQSVPIPPEKQDKQIIPAEPNHVPSTEEVKITYPSKKGLDSTQLENFTVKHWVKNKKPRFTVPIKNNTPGLFLKNKNEAQHLLEVPSNISHSLIVGTDKLNFVDTNVSSDKSGNIETTHFSDEGATFGNNIILTHTKNGNYIQSYFLKISMANNSLKDGFFLLAQNYKNSFILNLNKVAPYSKSQLLLGHLGRPTRHQPQAKKTKFIRFLRSKGKEPWAKPICFICPNISLSARDSSSRHSSAVLPFGTKAGTAAEDKGRDSLSITNQEPLSSIGLACIQGANVETSKINQVERLFDLGSASGKKRTQAKKNSNTRQYLKYLKSYNRQRETNYFYQVQTFENSLPHFLYLSKLFPNLNINILTNPSMENVFRVKDYLAAIKTKTLNKQFGRLLPVLPDLLGPIDAKTSWPFHYPPLSSTGGAAPDSESQSLNFDRGASWSHSVIQSVSQSFLGANGKKPQEPIASLGLKNGTKRTEELSTQQEWSDDNNDYRTIPLVGEPGTEYPRKISYSLPTLLQLTVMDPKVFAYYPQTTEYNITICSKKKGLLNKTCNISLNLFSLLSIKRNLNLLTGKTGPTDSMPVRSINSSSRVSKPLSGFIHSSVFCRNKKGAVNSPPVEDTGGERKEYIHSKAGSLLGNSILPVPKLLREVGQPFGIKIEGTKNQANKKIRGDRKSTPTRMAAKHTIMTGQASPDPVQLINLITKKKRYQETNLLKVLMRNKKLFYLPFLDSTLLPLQFQKVVNTLLKGPFFGLTDAGKTVRSLMGNKRLSYNLFVRRNSMISSSLVNYLAKNQFKNNSKLFSTIRQTTNQRINTGITGAHESHGIRAGHISEGFKIEKPFFRKKRSIYGYISPFLARRRDSTSYSKKKWKPSSTHLIPSCLILTKTNLIGFSLSSKIFNPSNMDLVESSKTSTCLPSPSTTEVDTLLLNHETRGEELKQTQFPVNSDGQTSSPREIPSKTFRKEEFQSSNTSLNSSWSSHQKGPKSSLLPSGLAEESSVVFDRRNIPANEEIYRLQAQPPKDILIRFNKKTLKVIGLKINYSNTVLESQYLSLDTKNSKQGMSERESEDRGTAMAIQQKEIRELNDNEKSVSLYNSEQILAPTDPLLGSHSITQMQKMKKAKLNAIISKSGSYPFNEFPQSAHRTGLNPIKTQLNGDFNAKHIITNVPVGSFLMFGDKIENENIPSSSMPSLVLKTRIPKSGQLIHKSVKKVIFRNALSLLASSGSVMHVTNGDFIKKNTPLLTLSFQRIKTGDIVQGIPKIEQYFEARTTKGGRLFKNSIPFLLKECFQRYRWIYPNDLAVKKSVCRIQQLLVDGILRVYKSQGVTIADKHVEIIVKQMTSKVQILNGGQSGFLPGELIDLDFALWLREKLTSPNNRFSQVNSLPALQQGLDYTELQNSPTRIKTGASPVASVGPKFRDSVHSSTSLSKPLSEPSGALFVAPHYSSAELGDTGMTQPLPLLPAKAPRDSVRKGTPTRLNPQDIIMDGIERSNRTLDVQEISIPKQIPQGPLLSEQIIPELDSGKFVPTVGTELFKQTNDNFLVMNIKKKTTEKVVKKINQIEFIPIILGISRASLEVESFLSAASFQHTKKVLSQAALFKKKDFLKGLKENVMIGNLMPAGTGFISPQ
uniref:DNA-directed RNA polymerase subunit beta'' n=1 Tax=Staurocarteria cerasiformis TaxID=69401 RepID=A0A0S2LPY8_STACE|nr:beta'' subunit of RNA polymerase [Carteria cerasiformis]ALO63454.1 beta'' subunit of RNA polymerase [Carteria cerasiformis]